MITRRHFTASAAGLALSATGLVCPGFTQVGNATARILVGFSRRRNKRRYRKASGRRDEGLCVLYHR
jgi:hypothetical protein